MVAGFCPGAGIFDGFALCGRNVERLPLLWCRWWIKGTPPSVRHIRTLFFAVLFMTGVTGPVPGRTAERAIIARILTPREDGSLLMSATEIARHEHALLEYQHGNSISLDAFGHRRVASPKECNTQGVLIPVFEITPDDIARLNDEQLRAVVARLCEAELRKRGYSTSAVTWGGNQNAADGGIDVRIALPPGTAIDGFVPRPVTGFQVKQQDMPAGEIADEMRPKGVIRPSIQSLAEQSGSYIIVSSQGSTADTALTSRRSAMTEAVAGTRNAEALFLDVYDRTRVASWVRSHEGLIPWVRGLVGRVIQGWQSYGAWAYAPDGVTAEYLLDDKLRVHPVRRESDQGLSAVQGLRQIRGELRQVRHVVRLVGLSGVGKTRLVQALFDDEVGEHSLDPALAIYTNMADGPDPQPIGLASNLAAVGTRAILIIDNCPPDLHHRLSEVCRQSESKLSVITVEYDIREDEPEGTEVYTLESSSPELIEKLVGRRIPSLSQVDARTIAEFSGGNARIAIALATTVERNETVAGLTDEQLFQRLFRQRHAHDESLYLAAQACALVYSFEGEDIADNEGAELVRLGRLIGRTPEELYRSVAELQRRDLVQRRSVWRAVLPHAIANRLAATALQNIPYATIEPQLVGGSSERLMRSFSRRLGYLDASKEAVVIVRKWLGVGGLLEQVAELNDLGRAMFENIAPVAPEETLAALERVLLTPQGNEAAKECKKYCDLLRSLAYDAALFESAVALLVKIVTAEDINEQSHGTKIFVSLFHLVLSGTHAIIEQRVAVIHSLLASPEEKQRALGVLALKAVLEALHFLSVSSFDFGARSRDFGYWPRTKEDAQHWFAVALLLVETFACGKGPAAAEVRAALAEKFRGLWLSSGCADEIVRVCSAIHKVRFWPEGWLAVRQALDLDGKGFDEERLAKLVALEIGLRPADLLQKVRAIVFSTRWQGVDLDDFEDHSAEEITTRMARTEALAQDLGKAVATDEAVLAELLPEVVTSDGRLLWWFGQGLVTGASDPAKMWNRLVATLAATEEEARRPQVLRGLLCQLRATDAALATALLDETVVHDTLAGLYPFLQVAVPLAASDIARLKRSVALGRAPATAYGYLAYGRATDPIPAPELKELILGIAALPSGQDVAIEVLQMRLHSDIKQEREIAAELIETGRELLQQIVFTRKNDRGDHWLGEIGAVCLAGGKGAAVVVGICQRLKSAVAKYETSASNHDDLLVGLFTAQPIAALDGLCGGDQDALERGIRVLRDVHSRSHPLAVVSDEDLLRWSDIEPEVRYPAMAGIITISTRAGENTPPRWTSLALRFLEKAPDPNAILRIFTSHFSPAGGWSGSLSTILESNATLLDQLEAYPTLRDAVIEQKTQLRNWIEGEQSRERLWNRERDERFE